ncbi:ABC transporter permease [Shinella daejeonensis]|uniref:ABC transporter permease n=1 Tax=Shinella daejeonensis TaxID=659017 RepID=UPI0020C78843|nr:ABC transporter permease [Shinella daejeonensis]MCP8896548.1 ABC transporter permease [Shinella daejeonensis]
MKSMKSRWASAIPLFVLIGLCVAIAVLDPKFLSLGNIGRIAAAASAPLVLALGATFIILMGSIDLSVEGAMAFAGAVLAAFVANASGTGFDIGLAAIPIALLAAAAFGCFIGMVHVYLKVPSFMASLGMGFVGIGIATVLLGGERVGILDQNVRALALTRVLGLPLSVYVSLFMLAVAWFIQDHTRIGRHIMALGGGEDLAAASGINVRRVRLLAFTIAGMFFGVGAVLTSARLGASSALLGSGQLFTAISAVVVGGTALTGGKGGVLQTVIGVLIVIVLNNGMIILGLPSFVQQGVLGLAIILAVLLNSSGRSLAIVK